MIFSKIVKLAASRSKYSNNQVGSNLQRQHLRASLIVFLTLLSIPLIFLIQRSYEQINKDTLQKYVWKSQHITKQINDKISLMIQIEENRPASDYQFFKLSDQAAYGEVQLTLSPLASIPDQSKIPGIIGFFQVDNDGLFSCPTLPQTENEQLKAEFLSENTGSGFDDLDERLNKREEVRKALLEGGFIDPTQQKTEADQSQETPEVVDLSSKPLNRNEIIVRIEPFQFKKSENGKLIFYRQVWRGPAKIIQGFVVSERGFLSGTLKPLLLTANFNTATLLTLHYQSRPFDSINHNPRKNTSAASKEQSGRNALVKHPVFVYKSALNKPLHDIELEIKAASLPLEAKAITGVLILGSLSFLILLGVFFIYRLGCKQIKLNEDRLNFVSAISHELKTPLTSIIMYAEMLRDGLVRDEQKKQSYYEFIYGEGERLGRLLSNVLHLAKLGRDTPDIALEYTPVSTIINLVRSRVSTLINNNDFTLNFCDKDFRCDTYEVLIDKDAFLQIALNLVDNAIKFSKELSADASIKQCVDIRFKCANSGGGFLCFSVRDYGPGVNQEDGRHIFDLFYRSGEELTRKTQGTGIGLALVSELCKAMNGSVDYTNHDQGVEFQVFIPYREHIKE